MNLNLFVGKIFCHFCKIMSFFTDETSSKISNEKKSDHTLLMQGQFNHYFAILFIATSKPKLFFLLNILTGQGVIHLVCKQNFPKK